MRSQAYNLFSRRIHKKAKEKRFPLRVMFEITYRCNFNCPHCYVPERFRKEPEERELNKKEVFSVLDQLRDLGCFYLGFTGGEPFLRDDFLDILRYAKKKGFEIIIYTNGSLINEGIAEALRELRPNKIDITINSLKKEPFERVTLAQDSHEKVFRAVELLYKRNIPLGFKSCLLKENEDEIGNIKQFADTHNALHRLDTMLMPKLNGSKDPYNYKVKLDALGWLGSSEQFDKAECSLTDPMSSAISKRGLFKCGVGLHNMVISPFGEVKMCLSIDYPKCKILESSLGECWQDLKRLVDSVKAEQVYKCDGCRLQPYCGWCPARSWLESGKFNSCVPESKERAEYNRLKAQENSSFSTQV